MPAWHLGLFSTPPSSQPNPTPAGFAGSIRTHSFLASLQKKEKKKGKRSGKKSCQSKPDAPQGLADCCCWDPGVWGGQASPCSSCPGLFGELGGAEVGRSLKEAHLVAWALAADGLLAFCVVASKSSRNRHPEQSTSPFPRDCKALDKHSSPSAARGWKTAQVSPKRGTESSTRHHIPNPDPVGVVGPI